MTNKSNGLEIPLFLERHPTLHAIGTKAATINITNLVRRKSGITHDNSSMDGFDSLKREATKLERNLEDKVARYQQVRMCVCLCLCVCLCVCCKRLGVVFDKPRRFCFRFRRMCSYKSLLHRHHE